MNVNRCKNCTIPNSPFKRNSSHCFWRTILATSFKIGRPNLENSHVKLEDIKKIYNENNDKIIHIVSKHVNLVSSQVEAIDKNNDIDSLVEQMEYLNLNMDKEKSKQKLLDNIFKPYLKISGPVSLEL